MLERWQQVEEIFHTAVRLKPEERASFLSEACASDRDLLAEVESLISAHEQPGSFLDSPAYEVAADLLAAAEDHSLVGKSIGQYEVVSFIGKGGMGYVYLARDTRLNRKVALKLLAPRFTAEERGLHRFMFEARAASSLNHPNILTIHEIGQVESVHFIATEFIAGHTLRHLLKSGRMKLHDTLDIAIQAAGALSAAHQAGIVHRDIKPENIMLRPDGYVKVLDFGLAKLEQQILSVDSGATTTPKLDTDTGTVMGTIRYMSPEQARGHAVDARSDIFALAVVIYEMITGRQPFEGETTADVVASIIKAEPPQLSDFTDESIEGLQQIVNRALVKDKQDRYQTAEEMLADLKAIKHELEFEIKRDSADAISSPASNPARFPFLRLLAPIVTAAVVTGSAYWLWIGQHKPPNSDPFSWSFVELHGWKREAGARESNARFSPDGGRVAFQAMTNQWLGIWVKQTSGGDPIRITADKEDCWSPLWSPDGQQIAFISDRGGRRAIWRIPALGGTPELLGTVESNFVELTHWSKDGGRIYFGSESNFFALEIASKTVSQITHFDEPKVPYKYFGVSPDENYIAYNATKDGQADIWVTPMRGGLPRQLTNDSAEDNHPVWHPDGSRIIYVSKRARINQISVAYLDGSPPVQMTVGRADHKVSDVSADGTRLLDVTSSNESDVFRVEIDLGREVEISSQLGIKIWPEISPDGQVIAFQSANEESTLEYSSIIAKPLNGGQQAQLASEGFIPTWSPDGSKLAFLRFADKKINIFTVNAIGGDERQLTTEGIQAGFYSYLPYNLAYFRDYSWSPDSGRIVYSSRKSGQSNLWTINADSSGETQITSNTDANLELNCPLWSSDGTRIAYLSQTFKPLADGKRVWSVLVAKEGKSENIFQAYSQTRLVGWSHSDNGLIVAVARGEYYSVITTDVALFEITPGAGKRAMAFLNSAFLNNIRLSPDKQTIAFVSDRDGADNIWVIPTVGGEARKITGNTDAKLYFASLTWSPDGKAIYYTKQSGRHLISMINNFT
jgi:Tol biopolymer transport system component